MTYQEVAQQYLEAARELVNSADDLDCEGPPFDELMRCLIEAETIVYENNDAEVLVQAMEKANLMTRMTEHYEATLRTKYPKGG